MKQFILAIFASLSCFLLGFNTQSGGGIQGKVAPENAVSKLVLIQGRDSLVINTQNGVFKSNGIKKGTYTLLVKAVSPYKDLSIKDVAIIDSAITDMGNINLSE